MTKFPDSETIGQITKRAPEPSVPQVTTVYEGGLHTMSPDLLQLRKDIIDACSIDTCVPAMRYLYDDVQKMAHVAGSNLVATILFIVKSRQMGRNKWYPLIVRSTYLPEHRQYYFLMYHDEQKIISGFSFEALVGGTTCFNRGFQLPVWEKFLSDPTLKKRVEHGARNVGINLTYGVMIDIFTKAFHEGIAANISEKAFYFT